MKKSTPKSERNEKHLKEAKEVSAKYKKTAPKMQFENTTPPGQKPNLDEFPDQYCPPRVECAWYSWWESQGYFQPNEKSDKKFIILLPPPNITGELHIGHAIPFSIIDALIRYHRMKGDDTLWIPGFDHAGISTQVRVEKMLKAEKGIIRNQLTREQFLSYAYEWTEKYSGKINKQIRSLGYSVDWSRCYFTLDQKCSKAVIEAFCRLFNKGKIYRAERLVNWDCSLQTAISDAEVNYKTITKKEFIKVPNHNHEMYPFGVLTYFKYQIADDEGKPTSETVTIATTRLETILGDEAICINSKDERYKHLHGKRVYNPFRKITLPIIIDDELADMEFGTGVVKVTPAHDPNDFETGLRHNLPFTNIFTEDGKINDIVPEFEGMPRFDARIAITEKMKEMGLYDHEEDHEMRLGITERGGDIAEQIIKKQWFLDTKSMAQRAIQSVDDGSLQILPSEFIKDWKLWHENIRPWCISRQLWWGHRIPAYQILIDGKASDDTDDWIAAHNEEEALELACEKKKIHDKSRITIKQDEDVLDTWFSAALLPFSSLGWPDTEDNFDFSRYFPGTCLQTGFDILTFWLSRMVMLSLELTDKLPFKTILLNPLIRDAQGRKMTKSLGNVINVFNIIDGIELQELIDNLKYFYLDEKEIGIATKGLIASYPNGIPQIGTDAMRLTFISYALTGRKACFNLNKIIANRNFCNKMWNAIKYALKFFNDKDDLNNLESLNESSFTIADKWILNKLNCAIKDAISGFEDFTMSNSIESLIQFFHDDFCSIYLEAIKSTMRGNDQEQKKIKTAILYECIETSLRLFHPFMPFITEDLWQRIPKRFETQSIMITSFPSENPKWSLYPTEMMENAIKISSSLRKMAQTHKLKLKEINAKIATDIDNISEAFDIIYALTGVMKIEQIQMGIPQDSNSSIDLISESIEVRIDLNDIKHFETEIKNTEEKMKKLLDLKNNLEEKMRNPIYKTKVPIEIQNAEKEKLDSYLQQINSLETLQNNLRAAIQANKK